MGMIAAYCRVPTVVFCMVLSWAGCAGSDKSDRKVAKVQPLDATTLFNSVAAAFIQKYGATHGDAPKVNSDRAFCTDDNKPTYVCNMKVKLVLGVTEDWVYNVRVDGRCWTAVTRDKYGANQDSVDAYRNREILAPSRREVARLVKDAKRFRRLRGCAETIRASRDPAAFLAQYVAQTVERERPGKQVGTTCKSKGKSELALAPDSWEYKCTTRLVGGKRYITDVSCFDPPPYKDFAACNSEDPKIPPRAIPGE